MIKKLDALLISYFPLLVAGYFIYSDACFATHIFWCCWLSMVINISFVLETYVETFTRKSSIFSILNLLFFGVLACLKIISLDGFLLSMIIGESGALIIAIIYGFLVKEGINNKTAWKTFGIGGAIGFVLLFAATIYPYIGEWILYLTQNEVDFIVLGGAFTSFIINIVRKVRLVDQVARRHRNDPNKTVGKQLEKATDTKNLQGTTVHILVSLGIWFFGLGTLHAVFVSTA